MTTLQDDYAALSRSTGEDAEQSDRVSRYSLHDQVVARLRELIVKGDLSAGERISERGLCERFGVSRTPLREAFKVLAWEGLLELTPNRGARVTELSLESANELFPVMGVLEALAGELACRRISEQQLEAIRADHREMIAHYERGDRAAYFGLNQRIHEAIIDAAGNPTLTRLYKGLAGRLRRMRYIANLRPERWRQAVEEHEEILLHLRARDGEALAAALKRHMKNKFETVKDYLGEGGSPAAG